MERVAVLDGFDVSVSTFAEWLRVGERVTVVIVNLVYHFPSMTLGGLLKLQALVLRCLLDVNRH